MLDKFIKEKKNLINEEKNNIIELKEKLKNAQNENITKLEELKNQIKINENNINKIKMDIIKDEKLIITFISSEEKYYLFCSLSKNRYFF